jgi:hypothetical protein
MGGFPLPSREVFLLSETTMVASLPDIRPVDIGAWREGSLARPGVVQRRIDVAGRPATTTTDETTVDAQRRGDALLARHVADAPRLSAGPHALVCAPAELKTAAKRPIPITLAAKLPTAPRLAGADRTAVGFADVQSADRAKIANFDLPVDHEIEKVQRGRFL